MTFLAILASIYLGANGSLQLPQGGGDMARRGGGAIMAGWYASDFWAIEGEAGWMERQASLAVKGLWHWWGYERFDPFFTFGARGWFPKGEAGPCAGTGFFYHLTDHWSLRADAEATLGLERDVEMVYMLGAGVQYEF
ncbi:MAG: hypothetical protein IKP97_01015 [Kiritimatiellae bacterium]|nr:hypothetical protein [Kiritimatiellia bacterium]